MTDALAHRGPDGRGEYLDGSIGLGHRRLAIIDLEGGKQPMASADGRYHITFNGEIYNFIELRRELEQAGCLFQTRSDTEVILHGFARWGAAVVPRLRGMFAFCIVDTRERRYLLARDHFGIKPLLYAATPQQLAFASEFGPLRLAPGLALTGSLPALEFFLRYQYIPAPQTVFAEIRKLPAAHLLEGSLDAPAGQPRRYWHLKHEPAAAPGDWIERADAVLRESVQAHLIADVPVGVFVSGGIDSTLVAWKMRQLVQGPMFAFSMGFRDEGFSELPFAQEAAKRIGIELITETTDEEDWPAFEGLLARYGEPFGDNSMLPTWQLARLARRHVPVALSGDGGDEGFAGYGSYAAWTAVPRLKEHWRRLRRRFSGAELGSLLWALSRRLGGHSPRLREWERLMEYVGPERRRSLWRPELGSLADLPNEAFAQAHARAPRGSLLDYAQHMDFETYLPGCVLQKVDVASMCHSLEVRTPLLDRVVVEFAAGVPPAVRTRGRGEGVVGKALLKDVLARLMGEPFVHRAKRGFGIPRARWFDPGRPARKRFEEIALDPAGPLREWFEPREMAQLAAEHGGGKDRSAAMWLLLVLGLWRRQNADLRFA